MVALLTALSPCRTERDEVHKDACIQDCGLLILLQHDLPLFPRCCTDDQSTVLHRSGMKMLLRHVEHEHILCLELVLGRTMVLWWVDFATPSYGYGFYLVSRALIRYKAPVNQ